MGSAWLLAPLSATCLAAPALAQTDEVDALRREVAAQRERIDRLEALVEQQSAIIAELRPPMAAQQAAQSSQPAIVARSTQTDGATAPVARERRETFGLAGLDVYGDARVRQEFNFSDRDGRDRRRTVVRARIGATYQATPAIAFGARLVTGDADDPNTSDVTLGNFVDDIPVALDQLWVRYQAGGLTAYAGKFPQILDRTDMVWDGDVQPQGAGLSYLTRLGEDVKIGAKGIYFVVDEASGGRDSDMLGAQGSITADLSDLFEIGLVAGYYDYDLRQLGNAGAGDFRGNLIAGGRYLSDFRLLDIIARLRSEGLGERWPVALTANYVRNLGAAVPEDTGFDVAVALGRAQTRGDWRFAYNYSEVEVDAVLAAFSHDNLAISTNYALHGLTVDHMLADNLAFSLNWYHYRPLDAAYAGANLPDDWLDRVRLNLAVDF